MDQLLIRYLHFDIWKDLGRLIQNELWERTRAKQGKSAKISHIIFMLSAFFQSIIFFRAKVLQNLFICLFGYVSNTNYSLAVSTEYDLYISFKTLLFKGQPEIIGRKSGLQCDRVEAFVGEVVCQLFPLYKKSFRLYLPFLIINSFNV